VVAPSNRARCEIGLETYGVRWTPCERRSVAAVSQENVEIVRQAHEAFNRPDLGAFDIEALYRHADPDLVVDWSRSHGLEAQTYRGEAATRRFWDTFFEVFERVAVEPLDFVDHGELVVVPHHFRALGRSGIEVEAHSAVVFTVRDERIVEMRLYRTAAEALQAAG
jgi:ketosteroid isomerase-like protein